MNMYAEINAIRERVKDLERIEQPARSGGLPVYPTLTPGSVLFAGTGGVLAQDNSNLFWDDSGNSLSVNGVAVATVAVTSTYTPTYTGLSSAGVTTYTTQVGRYFKTGQFVVVSVFLNWSAATGTGIALISLPFAPLYTSSIRYVGGATKGGNVRTALAEAGGGAQVCYLVTGGAAEAVTGTGDITLTLSYFTA